MWKRRHTLELVLFTGVISFLIWLLPAQYKVSFSYRIKGKETKLTEYVSALKGQKESPLSSIPLKCKLKTKDLITCSSTSLHRTFNEELRSWILQEVPQTLGWTNRTNLQKRIQSTEAELSKLLTERHSLNNSISRLELTAQADDKVAHEAELILKDLKNQLENRETQLSLLKKAIETKENQNDDVSIFKEKEEKVVLRIKELHSEIQEAERFLTEVSAPSQSRKKFKRRLSEILETTQSHQYNLATWGSALLTHPSTATLPDPDSFQFSTFSGSFILKPQRTFRTFLWAPFLALLIFGWIRPLRIPPKTTTTFKTEKEVVEATNWTCLGKL